jgi:hypothetical protein
MPKGSIALIALAASLHVPDVLPGAYLEPEPRVALLHESRGLGDHLLL